MAWTTDGPIALLICVVISRMGAELTFTVNPVHLTESIPAGTALSQAYDPVVNGRRNVYSIVGHSDQFSIDPNSGVVTNKKVFNFERDDKMYTLMVASSFIVHKDRKQLTINIIDVAETPECTDPQFVMGRANVTIDENSPGFQSIYRVEATDEDLVHGDKLTYTLEKQLSMPKEGGTFFSQDPETGIVSRNSNQPLDYDEGYHMFQLVIKVTDTTGNFCWGTLTVNIQDLNDEKAPSSDSLNMTAKELVESIATTVRAADQVGSSITYASARSQTASDLDSTTGTIAVLEPLEADTKKPVKGYLLRREARDNGNAHTAHYTVTTSVEDVNNPPVCDPSFSTGAGISVSVPETVPAATAVYTILARDPDPGEAIEFSILKASANTTTYFLLDPASGEIYRTSELALDYEKDPKHFHMVISAKEKGKASPGSCTGTITINIQNINDETPIFRNTSTTHVDILENLPFGTMVAKLTAEDRDIGDRVHYEFVDSYRDFSINADTGEITTTRPLDYEDPTVSHTRVLEIRAFDSDRKHSATAQLQVTLEDVNDNVPTCTQDLYVIQCPETIPLGTSLVTLKCEDRDRTPPNNILTYNLTLDDFSNETFFLDGNTVKVGPQGLNYDSESFAAMQFKHTLVVKVYDGGMPSQTSTITIIVKVSCVNEITPHTGTNIFHVLENRNIGTVVGRVVFKDEDWPFHNLKYSIVGDNVGYPPPFYIEPETGIIRVLNTLDREAKSQYVLWVKATDLDNDVEPDPTRQLFRLAMTIVNIVNVNDESPVCVPPFYETVIYSTVKTPIVQLNCVDKDSPAHNLSYTIVGGNAHNRFKLQRLGSGSPSLVTTQSFQYDVFRGIQDPTVFQLLIEVADELGGNLANRLSTTATITVHVTPWMTTKPSSTTKTTTTAATTSVLVQTLYYWHPDKWFPAILAIAGALLLMSFYMVAWGCFKDIPKCGLFFPQCCADQTRPPLPNAQKTASLPRKMTPAKNQPRADTNLLFPANSNPATVYDGRALDPVTGMQYLFNSKTGDIQWLNQKISSV